MEAPNENTVNSYTNRWRGKCEIAEGYKTINCINWDPGQIYEEKGSNNSYRQQKGGIQHQGTGCLLMYYNQGKTILGDK